MYIYCMYIYMIYYETVLTILKQLQKCEQTNTQVDIYIYMSHIHTYTMCVCAPVYVASCKRATLAL